MTRVELTTGSGAVGVRMEGHAEQGAYGEDVVCGALSMLAYTMAQNLSRLEAQGKLSNTPILTMESGFVYLEAHAGKGHESELLHGLEVIRGGFQLLAESFPQAVELYEKEGF